MYLDQQTTVMHHFKATLQIIDINPFVFVPSVILDKLFQQSGKSKGFIPIKGKVNEKPYEQTLVKYKGEWRLYINMMMLENSPKRIGEILAITVAFDPSDRSIIPHPKLEKALENNSEAKTKFNNLSPSLQKEIIRYISFLKTEKSIERNVEKAINFLLGRESFIGRPPLK